MKQEEEEQKLNAYLATPVYISYHEVGLLMIVVIITAGLAK
jgi:hypothetical protein